VKVTFTSRFVASGHEIFLRLGNDVGATLRRNCSEMVLGVLR
jgi:hypothetical protein